MEDQKRWEDLFDEAVDDVLKMRNDRAKIYGTTYAQMEFEGNAWHAINKAGRLKFQLLHGANDYEKIEDTLIDGINYMLFALSMLRHKKAQCDKSNGGLK